MPKFEIVEAKTWHCGAMARLLRRDQQDAVALIGLNSHRELRTAFDDSIFRHSWFIDGKLAAMGGVMGPAIASYGVVWLAFSRGATKYPLAMVKMVRRELNQIMVVKRLLVCTILDDDEASARFAIFMGFVPRSEDEFILPASSRFGRKEVARKLKEIEGARIPFADRYIKVMQYQQLEA